VTPFALAYAAAALLTPTEAAHRAAEILGRPDLAGPLVAVCRRESRCQAIGVHPDDAWVSDRSWGGQVQLGHLDRGCQPRGPGDRWGPRGAWGMSAADAWPYLGTCYQPEAIDHPLVGALAAGRMWLARCDGRRRSSWCPRVRT
jgi:hypothetical protein